MNNLVIPPSPNWYESKILTCTVDNTVVYGSRNEIVVIKPRPPDQPADVRIISPAHYDRVVCVDATPNWGHSKLVVSAGDDKLVKLWDLENYDCRGTHNTHTAIAEKLIGTCFAGNDRVISVSENGFLSIWRIGKNEVVPLKNLFNFKVHITCISSCVHASWLTAFGLKCGLVVLADIRKSGKVLYKLRGHDKSVVALSWCPTPFNIFSKTLPSKNRKIFNINKEASIHSSKKINELLESNLEMVAKEIETVKCDSDETNSNLENIETKDAELCQTHSQIICEESNTDIMKKIKLVNVDTQQSNSNGAVSSTNDEQQILELTDYKLNSTEVAEGRSYAKEVDETLCKSENIVELISDSELDNEIQEIFQPTKEYLLASSARGGSIYIWRAGTDGRIQKELPVGGKANRKNYKSNDKAWITICWITPEILLSSSFTGELLQWNLLKTNENTSIPQKKLIHHDHRTNMFCIAAPVCVYHAWEEENWQNRKDLHAWTTGHDRFLLDTSLSADRATLAAYPTIGGFIYCLVSSPVDPNRIAVGIGDNTAKIWDLSRPHLQYIIMSNLWQKIQSKVLTLAWHPSKEIFLAYGTFEGRIGIIDTNNTAKMPVLLCQYFRTSVHNIEWGPINGNIEDLGLYACGEGKLVLYNTAKPLEDPILVHTPAKEYITYMAWKPNYSIFAVATRSGSIALYDLRLKYLMTIYGEYKTIQTLQWHPEATAEDIGSSPYAFWLASGTNNASIVIYDLTRIQDEGEGTTRFELVAVLSGHSKPVRKLAWSSYESGKLASCGEDGIANIWDVKTKSIQSMYIHNNFDSILSILWSPLDKNYIMIGCKDQTIRIWNILEHPPKSEAEVAEVLKMRGKLKAELKRNAPKEEISDDEEELTKVNRGQMLHCTSKIQNANAEALIEDCRRLLNKTSSTSESETDNDIDILKLFGDRDSMINLLEAEQKKHDRAGRGVRSHHLSLWKGDLSKTIKEAIQQGNVTPWLISMAPMVSPKLWQEACEAYAKKLTENAKSDPIETASYLLACHKVEDAIHNLCDATLFREALAVAKCRLPSSDPIINNIIQKWATYNIVCGSYEVAAQCFISLGQYEEAAKALFKRTSPNALEFAVELAKKSENKELLDAVITRYNCFKASEEKVESLTTIEDKKLDRDLLTKAECVSREIGSAGQSQDLVEKLNSLEKKAESLTTIEEQKLDHDLLTKTECVSREIDSAGDCQGQELVKKLNSLEEKAESLTTIEDQKLKNDLLKKAECVSREIGSPDDGQDQELVEKFDFLDIHVPEVKVLNGNGFCEKLRSENKSELCSVDTASDDASTNLNLNQKTDDSPESL